MSVLFGLAIACLAIVVAGIVAYYVAEQAAHSDDDDLF
jgi:hypothetical protein